MAKRTAAIRNAAKRIAVIRTAAQRPRQGNISGDHMAVRFAVHASKPACSAP